MNKEFEYLIYIIKCVLKKEKVIFDETINLKKLYYYAKNHHLISFLYYGLKDFDLNDFSKLLNKEHQTLLYESVIKDAEQESLLNVLEEACIKHLPLKGAIIKKLYPSMELRFMADFDCLFDSSKAKVVKQLMKDNGYTIESFNRGNHDIYFKHPYVNVEMHRELMNEAYKISKYYKTIWNNVKLKENKKYEYLMTNEDFYIFMIAHMAKHFVNGGIGIRNVIDIYLFLDNYINLDFNYINNELVKLGLLTFSNSIIEITKCYFSNYEMSDLMKSLSDYLMNSGTFGNIENSTITRLILSNKSKTNLVNSKIIYVFRRMFPPFSDMKLIFSFLNKLPFLLPFAYLIRLFKALFKFKKGKYEMDTIHRLNQEKIDNVVSLKEELNIKNGI